MRWFSRAAEDLPPAPSTSSHDDMCAQMLAEARTDVAQADQKASILLAALGVGFGAVLGGQLAGGFDSADLSPLGEVVWWLGVGLATASIVCAALAVWPRYRTDDHPQYGITYWGHIAAFDSLAELEAAMAGQQNTARRTTHQLWRLSRVVLVKYRCVRLALILSASAAAALSYSVLVLH